MLKGIKSSVVVNFSCPQCGENVTEIIDGVHFLPLQDNETPEVLTIDNVFQCQGCKNIYDLKIDNSKLFPQPSIAGYPDTLVRLDGDTFYEADDDSDEWLDWPPPSDPYAVLMDAYHRLSDIVAEYGSDGRGSLPHSSDVINRMVYAAAISAMEAFLSDLLIRTTFSHEPALRRLLAAERDLKDMSVSLLDVHRNPEIVAKKTREFLADFLYHRLKKVSELYYAAFKIDIGPGREVQERLNRAVATRHDIVHRNGKRKDGEQIDIAKSDVIQLLNDVQEFAKVVRDKVIESITKTANER